MNIHQEGFVGEVCISMVYYTCCTCGVPFGLPAHLANCNKKLAKSFQCPNGHGNVIVMPQKEQISDAHKTELLQLRHEIEVLETKLTEAQTQNDNKCTGKNLIETEVKHLK